MSQLKRAHSADPDASSTPGASQGRAENSVSPGNTGQLLGSNLAQNVTASPGAAADAPIGSPLKKARPSIDQGIASESLTPLSGLGVTLDPPAPTLPGPTSNAGSQLASVKVEEEEEEL